MDAVKPQHSARPPGHDPMAPPTLQTDALKTQTSPNRGAKDAKSRRTSPKLLGASIKKDASPLKSTTTRQMGKAITRTAPTAGKPLLPVTERRSHEDKNGLRGKRETETDKWDVAPDGSSAGREGRQFTVANVGNNGRIYLRPSVRPAHQRYPQPNFTFPVTPPGAGGLEALSQVKTKGSKEGKADKAPQLQASQWTPTPSTSPLAGERQCFPDPRNPSRPTRHRRAMSDSTVHEVNVASESDKDTFKVIISKPGDEKRPRTMDDLNSVGAPLLNINIPSWRIGTPRFTLKGTPVIRGSSYAPTEDIRSSSASLNQSSTCPNVPIPELGMRKFNPLAVHPPPNLQYSAHRGAPGLPSPRLLRPMRSTYMSTHLVIEPAMFTDLTFKPACDDRSIVRYSPAGAVTAASPPRLVAEITSPSFLDYELISDFFLTFRAFLEPTDLLCMLVARLRWALARNDELGMIVRVRTFVAVRHWILNYFVDDFVLEYDLRVTFCNLLNEFVDELSQDASCRKVQLKILAELKKCWRRVCAQYWDGPEFDDSLSPEVPIAPGGVAANRDANLDPGYWEREGVKPPQLDVLAALPKIATESTSLYAEGPRAVPIGDFIVLGNRPGTPENQVIDGADMENGTGSPLSLASLDIVSCSFPSKSMKAPNPNPAHLMAVHPVSSASVNNGSGPVATTPKALVGKRVRPTQTHKRNNSISDSLREHGSDKSSSHDQDFSMTWQSAGSLVRGNLLPPGQAYVDYEPHGPYGCNNRQTTIFQPKDRNLAKERAVGGAMSGYGMRKLLGSVRRALRNRGQSLSPIHGHFMSISPVGPRGATTNRLPGTAVVPQDPPRQNGGRPPVRIDLLGAEVAEDFKEAVREEEAAAEAERLGLMVPPNSAPPFGVHPEYSAAHMESSTFDSLPQNQKQRPFSDMAITIGSKSIVIVDDTVPFEMAPANGPYPPMGNPSVDTLTDTFMPSCADPTPPNTPPANATRGDTPRRSSYLLNQHVVRPPLVDDALPPFIPDLATLGGSQSTRMSEDLRKPSLSTSRRRMKHPPISGGTFRMHSGGRSMRTHQSLHSIMRRRYNSFSSGVLLRPIRRSFDATTEFGASAMDNRSGFPVPAPLRVLRRRPGGDLRAATNVGDLDRTSLRRSQSDGSLATYTESIRSSYLLNTRSNSAGRPDSVLGYVPEGRGEVFSLGQLAEKPAKRNLSLFSTHSSKPVMRPSFEQEAQKLAQIPDDEDDGGIESALLKLEGKYDKKLSKQSMEVQIPTAIEEWNALDPGEGRIDLEDVETQQQEKKENRHIRVIDEPVAAGDGGESDTGRRPTTTMMSFLSEGSHESYCSIPLLDRGLTDDGRSKSGTREWTNRSIFCGSDDGDSPAETERGLAFIEKAEAQHLSFDFIQKTDSIQRIKPGGTAPSEAEDQSFLEDDSAGDTDLSSELSSDGIGSGSVDGDEVLFSKHRSPELTRRGSGSLATTRNSPHQMALQALAMSPESCNSRNDPASQAWTRKPLPPASEMTPVVPQSHGPTSPCGNDAIPGAPKPETAHFRKYSVHLPFILAFDSDILAQQFTLIEKDALNEIDWKELIDMNWKNAARSHSRSWVDFLRKSDAQGVEVVIARFNIMVKWAISEIVLTQHIEERARCIIKLIHIASHCRRYRNFATLAQLAIALSSNEVSRLSKTWELVPAHDVKTLNSLEMLVTPSRNFHAIRAEMEMGSDAGCIPFVGIYTHDLLYNVQRPSEIASSPTTAPLVNFERCRIGAAVVKTLLRLLEASTRYFFLPIEGITERCLWIGALSDEEIRRHSESLE
ncbi:Guanine nucleotide exchange factor LTE1 [Tolypocladium ophioglossoides CBS 100239]|uniref:Guanine nucleotide exchange factor LTE1 n=1 Tax=Tolypocladium ophioglossoides (strain CBS 100239) TaxID=1163406 RepID=A0A0L0NJY1_TOLOC|nr:Guanine nucleotide exchange factor LTE1 [Tolypocladium ophioglossoides CBS 100239]